MSDSEFHIKDHEKEILAPVPGLLRGEAAKGLHEVEKIDLDKNGIPDVDQLINIIIKAAPLAAEVEPIIAKLVPLVDMQKEVDAFVARHASNDNEKAAIESALKELMLVGGKVLALLPKS
jgi:hypothetical protein